MNVTNMYIGSSAQLDASVGIGTATWTILSGALWTASGTFYSGLYGGISTGTSSTDSVAGLGRKIAGLNGVLRKYWIKARLNGTTGASTLTFRVNGADVATLNIPAGSTAFLETTNLAVAIADTDEIGVKAVIGAGGNLTDISIGALISPSDAS